MERDRLAGRIDRYLCAGIEVDRNGVPSAVRGLGFPGNVGNRAGQLIEIIGQRRRQESQRELHPRIGEGTDRARGQHLHTRLSQGRHARGLGSHQPIGAPIDSDQAGESMPFPRPMHRVGLGQFVGRRPDAEIGINRRQGHGGRAQDRLVLRGCYQTQGDLEGQANQ